MPPRKRRRKSRRPPTDPQPPSSKPVTAITPAEADRQGLSGDVASGAGLEGETELGQLTLQSRLDVAQAHVVVSDLGRKGHTYESPVVKDNARAHFGDVNTIYNFNQSSPEAPVNSEKPDLMKALSFNGMSDRLMGITPAYAEICHWILDSPEYLQWRDPSQ